MKLLGLLFTATLTSLAAGEPDNANLPQDVVSCLKESNLTVEEVSRTMFFNPNVTISPAARCFGACIISTDYNVSVSSDGIVEKEGLFLAAIMQDSRISLANATDVVDTCKGVVKPNGNRCDNIYNYATCVNQKYFELKGYDNMKQGYNILNPPEPSATSNVTVSEIQITTYEQRASDNSTRNGP